MVKQNTSLYQIVKYNTHDILENRMTDHFLKVSFVVLESTCSYIAIETLISV